MRRLSNRASRRILGVVGTRHVPDVGIGPRFFRSLAWRTLLYLALTP